MTCGNCVCSCQVFKDTTSSFRPACVTMATSGLGSSQERADTKPCVDGPRRWSSSLSNTEVQGVEAAPNILIKSGLELSIYADTTSLQGFTAAL